MTSNSPQASPIVGVKRSPDSPSDRENGPWTGDDSDMEDSHPDSSRKRVKKERESGRPVMVSCETCKLRKVKCDRGQPSCSWCLKNRQICEYKERKKPGLRAGYGRELEAKLAEQAIVLNRIQEMLLRHESAIAQLSSKSIHTAPSPRSTEGSVVHVNLDFQPRTDFGKESTQLPSISTYIPNVKSNVKPYGDSPHTLRCQAVVSQDEKGSMPALDEFPRPDLCHILCDLYFTHINSWLPILHRNHTYRRLFKHHPSQLEPSEQVLLHAIIATTLRFSTDGELSSDARHRQHLLSTERVQLYCLRNTSVVALQALSILTLDLIGGQNEPTAFNMITLLGRSAVKLGLTREPRPAGIGDLEKTPGSTPGGKFIEESNFIEMETERRLMWAIYILDRYSTVATSLDFSFAENIERRLPCHDDYFLANQPVELPWLKTEVQNTYSSTSGLGTFSYFVELVEILSRTHDLSRTSIDINTSPEDVTRWRTCHGQLEEQLSTWWYRLPPHYRNISLSNSYSRQDVVESGLVLLQVSYFTALIRLHSCKAYPIRTSGLLTPSNTAANLCNNAVDSMVQLLHIVRSRDLLYKTGPFFAVGLWTAARALIVQSVTNTYQSARSSPIAFHHIPFGSPATSQPATPTHHTNIQSSAPTVDAQINDLLNGLRALEECWPIAYRYTELLIRSLDELRNGNVTETMMILQDVKINASDMEAALMRKQGHISRHSPRRMPSSSRTHSSGDVKSPTAEREYLSELDLLENPRLPTGFDRIIDTVSSPREERYDHAHGRGRSTSHAKYPVVQNERRTEWVSHRLDSR